APHSVVAIFCVDPDTVHRLELAAPACCSYLTGFEIDEVQDWSETQAACSDQPGRCFHQRGGFSALVLSRDQRKFAVRPTTHQLHVEIKVAGVELVGSGLDAVGGSREP